jgi:hypothetical protein
MLLFFALVAAGVFYLVIRSDPPAGAVKAALPLPEPPHDTVSPLPLPVPELEIPPAPIPVYVVGHHGKKHRK